MVLKPESKIEVDKILPKLKKLVKTVSIATHMDGSPGTFIIFKIKDRYLKTKTLMIPVSDAYKPSKLMDFLHDNNFLPQPSREYYDLIQSIILEPVDNKTYLVRIPGFYGSRYLLTNNKIIGDKNKSSLMLDNTLTVNTLNVHTKGNLEEWQSNVARYAAHSSRLILGLASAFAAYLIHLTDMECGGFHLYGHSSTGKTTTLQLTISVQGSRENLVSWDISPTAIEQVAASRNDSILGLDELKLLDSDPKKAAEKATHTGYKLSQGKLKKRSESYQDYTLTWRLIILSSGESSLSENAQDGGIKRWLGEEVRFIDLPADAGKGHGIYESLPKEFQTGHDLAEHLNAATNQYYGTAQKAFLTKLTHDLERNTERVKQRVKTCMDDFINAHDIDSKKGHYIRFAKRFALVYAGGYFAIKYGILPFSEDTLMEGVTKCYQDALVNFKSFSDKVDEARQKVDRVLKSKDFLDITDKGHGYSCDDLRTAPVLKSVVKYKKPIPVKIILPEQMNTLVPDEVVLRELLEQYYLEGRMLRGKDRDKVTLTRTVNTKLDNCTLPRAYFFKHKSKPTKD